MATARMSTVASTTQGAVERPPSHGMSQLSRRRRGGGDEGGPSGAADAGPPTDAGSSDRRALGIAGPPRGATIRNNGVMADGALNASEPDETDPRTFEAIASPRPARRRLMCVHAHPDDESSKGAATMARYVREGVEVLVVTCTGGERGDILNPALADDATVLADMPGRRRAEMERAREILGVQQVWLGFVDSGLPDGDPLPPLPDG